MRLCYTRIKPWQEISQQFFLKENSSYSRTLPLSSIMDSSATDLHTPSNWSGPKYAWYDYECVESLEDYGAGGYHPTHLGDKFSGGRYEVIHKLGYGGYSIVWLCRDLQEQSCVSVKIAASKISGAQRQKDNGRKIYHALRIVIQNILERDLWYHFLMTSSLGVQTGVTNVFCFLLL